MDWPAHPKIDGWTPPDGFIEAPSAVAGVRVFKPAPVPAPRTSTAPGNRCPGCGAPLTRADTTGCTRCGHALLSPAPSPARHNDFTLKALRDHAHGWGTARSTLHCDGCGAALVIAPDHKTTTCSFCGASHLRRTDDAGAAVQPDVLIPFSVSDAQARQVTARTLRRGLLRPIAGEVTVAQAIYLPFWIFSAASTAQWQAQLGIEQKTRRYVASRRTWETRTTIKWRRRSGTALARTAHLPIPGTARIPGLEQAARFDWSTLRPYAATFLMGQAAMSYTVSLPTAWQQGRALLADQAREASEASAYRQARHVRDLSMSAKLSEETWAYALLPFFVVSIQHGEQLHTLLINGQSGAVTGRPPVDRRHLIAVSLAALVPGVLVLLCAGLPATLIYGQAGLLAVAAGLTVLGLGLLPGLWMWAQTR